MMTSPQRFVLQSAPPNNNHQPLTLTTSNEGYVQATSIVDNNRILLDNKNGKVGDIFDDKSDDGDVKCLLLESDSLLEEENQNRRDINEFNSDIIISSKEQLKLQRCDPSTNISNFSLENESDKFEIESSLLTDKFDYKRNLGFGSDCSQPAAAAVDTGYVAATWMERNNSSQVYV